VSVSQYHTDSRRRAHIEKDSINVGASRLEPPAWGHARRGLDQDFFFFFLSLCHFFRVGRDGRAFFNVACKPSCALCPSSSPLPPHAHRRFGVMSKLASDSCQVRFDAASTSCIQSMLHDRVARSPTVSRRMRMRSSSCSTCATAYLSAGHWPGPPCLPYRA
jgi:hypothetical protein